MEDHETCEMSGKKLQGNLTYETSIIRLQELNKYNINRHTRKVILLISTHRKQTIGN